MYVYIYSGLLYYIIGICCLIIHILQLAENAMMSLKNGGISFPVNRASDFRVWPGDLNYDYIGMYSLFKFW